MDSETYIFKNQFQLESLSGPVVDRVASPEAVVRAVYVQFRDRILSGVPLRVDVPGCGVLTWREREYRFELDAAFAEPSGLSSGDVLTGRWGATDGRDYEGG